MEDPRIISALFISLKMAYYNVLINNLILYSSKSRFFNKNILNENQVFTSEKMAHIQMIHLPFFDTAFLIPIYTKNFPPI